jgi:hypothetical protein
MHSATRKDEAISIEVVGLLHDGLIIFKNAILN